jgi:hypothetical protein
MRNSDDELQDAYDLSKLPVMPKGRYASVKDRRDFENRDKFEALAQKILPVLLPFGVRRVALFGSVVRDEDTLDSDVDILVTLRPPGERPVIGLRWFDLVEDLSRVLQRPVDLVTEDGLSPFIRPYVEQEMVVLYEAE